MAAILTGRGMGLRQFFVCEFCTFKLCIRALWPKKVIYGKCPSGKTRYWYSKPCLRSGINVIVVCSLVITAVLCCVVFCCVVLCSCTITSRWKVVKCTISGLLYPLNYFSSLRTLIGTGYLNLCFGSAYWDLCKHQNTTGCSHRQFAGVISWKW